MKNGIAWIWVAGMTIMLTLLGFPALQGLLVMPSSLYRGDGREFTVVGFIWVVMIVVGGWSSLKAFKQGNHTVRVAAVMTGIVSILSCIFYLMLTIHMAIDRY